MATRPMSVFDNFTETYMKARDARAREERAKELSMRQFEQSLMAQDQNQRAWNQEGRTADQYTNYLSPSQGLLLAERQRIGDVNAAGQAGAVNMARMAGDIKSRVAANPSYADNVYGTQINQNQQSFEASQAYNSLTPQQKDYFNKAGLYQRAAAGSQALEDMNYNISPEATARRQNTRAFSGMLVDQGIADMQKEVDARTQLAANAAKPSSVFQNNYTPTVGRTFGATTVSPPAAVNAPAMSTTTTPAGAVLPTSPMAAMAASKAVAPQAQRQVDAGAMLDAAKLNRINILGQLQRIGLAERARNPAGYNALLNAYKNAEMAESDAQKAWLSSPEAMAAQSAYQR